MTKNYIYGTICYILAVILFIAPFITLYLIKEDEWVVQAEGLEVATGVLIGLAYMFLVFKGALRRVAPLFNIFLTSIIFMLVTYFLDSIINDLFYITASVAIGLLFFLIFYKIGHRQFEIAKIYADEGVKIAARKAAETQQLTLRSRNVNAIK